MNTILDELIESVVENIEIEDRCRNRECEAYLSLPDKVREEIKQTYLDIIHNLDQHRITIYTTEQQIHRMKELITHYELGYADGDALYGFLTELNEQNRDLTFLEENMVIIGREEK